MTTEALYRNNVYTNFADRRRKPVLRNKKRFFIFLAITAFILSFSLYCGKAYGFREKEHVSITVAKGETIWSIAEDYCAGGDVRRLVYDIKSLNSLEDSFIYEGDTLIIPVR